MHNLKMDQKHQKLASKSMRLLSAILLCQALGAAARSVQYAEESDPMIALPSGQEPHQEVQYVTYQQQVAAQQPSSPRQEIVVEYQAQAQPAPEQQSTLVYQAQPERRYEVVQVPAQQQAGDSEQAAHSHNGVECSQRHELTALLGQRTEPQAGPASGAPSGEYPGQLIYVSQARGDADNLESLSKSWSRAADLPATILSEIPVRDMPEEVLNKLKREYGVKVVATRERPGANLVINCDEYAGQESSICNKHLASHEAAYQPQEIARGQVFAGEAVALPPRGHYHSFQHVERVLQPNVEASHVYVAEGPAEGQRAGEESRAGSEGDEYGGQAQSEQAAGEVRAPESEGSAAYASSNDEERRGASPISGQAGEETSVDSQSGRRREAYELGAGFDEQQKSADEQQGWQQGAGEQSGRARQAGEWAQSSAGTKQLEPVESYSAGQQTR